MTNERSRQARATERRSDFQKGSAGVVCFGCRFMLRCLSESAGLSLF